MDWAKTTTTRNKKHLKFGIWWPNIRDFTVVNVTAADIKRPGPWFNIKMSSYQYRKSHCVDKTILRPSYLHNVISYTGKMASLYWIRAQGISRYNFDLWWPSVLPRLWRNGDRWPIPLKNMGTFITFLGSLLLYCHSWISNMWGHWPLQPK